MNLSCIVTVGLAGVVCVTLVYYFFYRVERRLAFRTEEYMSARSSLKRWSRVLKAIRTWLFMKACLPGSCKSFA